MTFSTEYFSGSTGQITYAGSTTNGSFTASLSEDASNHITGSWTYSGSFASGFGQHTSGSVGYSGSITGNLSYTSASEELWQLTLTSGTAHFDSGDGDLDLYNGVFTLTLDFYFDALTAASDGYMSYEGFAAGAHLTGSSTPPPPPVVSIDHYTGRVPEDNDSISVTLVRSGSNLNVTSKVYLSTSDGAAVSSGVHEDFNAVTMHEVVFGPGVTTVTVDLDNVIIDDDLQESNENFHIGISDPVNATLGFSSGDITIVDNDAPQTLNGTSANDILAGGGGGDSISGSGGNDTITGGAGADQLNGGIGADRLEGGTGADTLLGGADNDLLDGGAGVDRMSGNDGNDTYIVDNTLDRVIEAAGQGVDIVKASADVTLPGEVEKLTLTNGAHAGTGNGLDNIITGDGVANVLKGLGGNDVLNGIDGNDTLYGGVGNDTLNGGPGTDSMIGGDGDDAYFVDNAGDVIVEQSGGGSDAVYASASYTLSASVEDLYLNYEGAFTATGNALGNHIRGNIGANVLNGRGGDDTLVGGDGADTLNGGAGNDLYLADSSDTVNEATGDGYDTVKSTTSFVIRSDIEHLILDGLGASQGVGNAIANYIEADRRGSDLMGRGGDDTLIGGTGHDTLEGDGGNDVLKGGTGNDTFFYNYNEGHDTIQDFSQTEVDQIVLNERGMAGLGALGNVPFGDPRFLSGGGLHQAPEGNTDVRLLYDTTSGKLYYDPDGAGGTAATLLVTLTGHPTLIAPDIQIVDQMILSVT